MLRQDGTASIVNISNGASRPAGSPTLVSRVGLLDLPDTKLELLDTRGPR
jgi:hypothetical protein